MIYIISMKILKLISKKYVKKEFLPRITADDFNKLEIIWNEIREFQAEIKKIRDKYKFN